MKHNLFAAVMASAAMANEGRAGAAAVVAGAANRKPEPPSVILPDAGEPVQAPQATGENPFMALYGKPVYSATKSGDVLELKNKRGKEEVTTGYQKTICDVSFPRYANGIGIQSGFRVVVRVNASKANPQYFLSQPRPSFQGAKPYLMINAEHQEAFEGWAAGIVQGADQWYQSTPAADRMATGSGAARGIAVVDVAKLGITF